MTELIKKLYQLLRHLGDDQAWRDVVSLIGLHPLYAVLFLIVFTETGVVIFPFLPGDSLLFAVGAMTARDIGISLPVVMVLLFCAAIIGDNCNYWLGRRVGPKVFSRHTQELAEVPEGSSQLAHESKALEKTWADRLLNEKHLSEAQAFYEKYGAKTIIIARFVPIVRTFAPFVAGVGKMSYPRFLAYSVGGAAAWVSLCVLAGWKLGGLPFFKNHFELVVLLIVIISLIPMVVEVVRAKWFKPPEVLERPATKP